MQTILTLGLVVIAAFFALSVGMNLFVRWKARTLEGKPLPDVPGPIGEALARARGGLVYFFSPQCGACRAITPKMRAMAEKNDSVFVIDVTEHLEIARAMQVLATPSTIEVADGRIVAVHVGMLPKTVEARFSS